MPQAVDGRGAEVGMPDDPPGLIESNGFNRLPKDMSDSIGTEPTVTGPGQQVRVVMVIQYVCCAR